MKNKKFIRLALVFAVLVTVLCQSFVNVLAIGFGDVDEAIDLKKPCSLTVVCKNGEDVFADLPVSIWKVADLSSKFDYTATEKFASYPINFNAASSKEEWNALSE
ncbi:MAG: hypothetical protein KBS44_04925, partial [Clostridiales bacterium]|nr:hypothetical protein [Candidatus Coliplasma equi]